MTALNAATVTKAIVEQLKADRELLDITVERSELLNTDASRTPWVGVYKLRQMYDIAHIGRGSASRRCTVQILIVCQFSDASSGDNAEDGLEQLVTSVMDSILNRETFGVALAARNIQVQYADVRNDGGVYFQEAAIGLSLVT
jgi:hypothetical protein